MRLVSEYGIETFEGAAADAIAFSNRLAKHNFPCFVFIEWNGSFHAADYQIVAEDDLDFIDPGTVDKVISVNCRKDARNAFLMLHQERLENARNAFKNSREYEYEY